jgi:hypothetical protein
MSGNTTFATRFLPEDLKANTRLTKISYYAYNNPDPNTANVTLHVWRGADANNLTLVYEQAVPAEAAYFTSGWHEVALTTPIDINTSEELWFGFTVGTFTVCASNGDESLSYIYSGGNWRPVQYPILLKGIVESKKTILSYTISRDSDVIGSFDANTLSYIDANLDADTYQYCVTAGYDNGEAEPVCIEITVGETGGAPVNNLQAVLVNSDDVQLNWEKPYTTGGSIGYYNSLTGWSSSSEDFTYAVCFSAEDLAEKRNLQLTEVNYWSGSNAPNNQDLTLNIWRGKDVNNAPGILIYEQQVVPNTFGQNTVTLTTPVDINVNDDLWIGIRVHIRIASTYNLYFDNSTDVPFERNRVYRNGFWNTSSKNYFIGGTVTPKGSLLSYTIARNSDEISTINNINQLSYLDYSPVNGINSYCVTANYTTGKSDPVCKNITVDNYPTGWESPVEQTTVYSRGNTIYAVSTASNPIRQVEIYNSLGVLIYVDKNVNTSYYTINRGTTIPEVCIVRLITEHEVKNVKLLN